MVALGDVLGDLHEAEEGAILAHGFYYLAGAEAFAAAAHPPAFAGIATLLFGLDEGMFGGAGRALVGRIEKPHMLPHHFFGGIALDPLAATVPAADAPLRVEQIDRVIGDVIDQQL